MGDTDRCQKRPVKIALSLKDFEDLWPGVDLIIDGDVLKDPTGKVSRRGSTVVNLCIPGTYSIIRDGW